MASLTPTQLSQRFAARLHNALTRMGYPTMPLDRARALAIEINLDLSTTSGLLNGLIMPNWDTLFTVCALTSREPGYFLDSTVNNFPTETKLVKPIDGGESIVLHLPNFESSNRMPIASEWSYLHATSPMGFGVTKGDYVISFSAPVDEMQLVEKGVYIFGNDAGYQIRQCDGLDESSATFIGVDETSHASNHDVLHIGLKASRIETKKFKKAGFAHFGEVTAVVRDYRFQQQLLV